MKCSLGILRNLYAGQEAKIRTGHGTTDCFQIGKEVHQGCILSLCLYNLYYYILYNNIRTYLTYTRCIEYIMRIAGLDEAQAGIKMQGEILVTSDMEMTPPLWQKAKRK